MEVGYDFFVHVSPMMRLNSAHWTNLENIIISLLFAVVSWAFRAWQVCSWNGRIRDVSSKVVSQGVATPDPALSRLESQLAYRNSNVMITDVVSQKANDTMPNSKQAYILADILSRCVLCLYSMARQTVYGFPRTNKIRTGNERIGCRLVSLINLTTQLI